MAILADMIWCDGICEKCLMISTFTFKHTVADIIFVSAENWQQIWLQKIGKSNIVAKILQSDVMFLKNAYKINIQNAFGQW